MALQLAQRNWLLAVFPAQEAESLAAAMDDIEVRPGIVLQESGEPIERVYFPQSAVVSLQRVSANGNCLEVGAVGSGGIIGLSRAFGERRSFTRAAVHVGGHVWSLPGDAFEHAVEKNPGARNALMRYGDFLLLQAQQVAVCNASHSAEARFARWLLERSDLLESNTIPATQEFIAQMFGVRRTTITVVAHEMQKSGVIRYRRGAVYVADRVGLRHIACECYDAIRRAHGGLSDLYAG